jgi:hypothetical protein
MPLFWGERRCGVYPGNHCQVAQRFQQRNPPAYAGRLERAHCSRIGFTEWPHRNQTPTKLCE